MTTKGLCPVCAKEISVKLDGTLHPHLQVEDWPGCRVKRRCTGSGLPPLGPWPRRSPHTADSMATADGLGG